MGSLHANLTGDELHIAKTNVSTGTPVGNQSAGIIGELYWDSTNNKLYVAEATGTANWINASDVNDEWIELADTPGTISAGLSVQGNSGGTALEFGQALDTTDSPAFSTITLSGSASSTTLSLDSTTGSLRLPRLTTTQRDALTPLQGMTIFNTTTLQVEDYSGTAWIGATEADEWTELSDTPGSISAGLSVQGNSGGTALEFGQALDTTDSPTFATPSVTRIRSGAGTELLPAYSFVSNTNRGMYDTGSSLRFADDGFDVLELIAPSLAANWLQINAAQDDDSAGSIKILPAGADNDIEMVISSKGSQTLNLNTGVGAGEVAIGVGGGLEVGSNGEIGLGVGASTPSGLDGLTLQIRAATIIFANANTKTQIEILSPADNHQLLIGVNDTGSNNAEAFVLAPVGSELVLSTLKDIRVAGSYPSLNFGYTTVAAQAGGLVVNYLPTSTADTVSSGAFVAGIATTSNSTVATVGAATFSASDIIQITGTEFFENDGLYEVLTHAANLLTIRGVGVTATVEDFTDDQFIANTSDSATITKVTVSVMRVGTDGSWETASGSASGFSFSDLLTVSSGITVSGTPVNNQVAIWTDSSTIEGDSDLTFDGLNLTAGGSISAGTEFQQAGSTILVGDAANKNLFVGLGTGASTVTGEANTAVGHAAMAVVTTGVQNTAIGSSALSSNTTGSNNITVGNFALTSNISGADNIAIGVDTLKLNTTGSNNTAIGSFALEDNLTGSENIGIGVSALENNVLGRRNIAIGDNAGFNVISATLTGENVFIGYRTGFGIITGVQNTIIGANVTGLSATLSNNIILADGAGVIRLQSDSSGNITIGGNLTVDGTTTTINSTTLTVDDKNIELGSVSSPTDTTADGGGITLKGTTDKTIVWTNATDTWDFNQSVNLGTGLTYKIAGTDVLSATTLGSGVVGSSLTSVGTLSSLTITGDLTVDTNTLFVDSTNNEVGIGTLTPSAKLDVHGIGTANTGLVIMNLANSEGASRIIFRDEQTTGSIPPLISSQTGFGMGIAAESGEISFYAGGIAVTDRKMTILSSGFVGIGSINPGALLHLQTSAADQLRLCSDASNFASFTVSSGGDLTIAPTGSDTIITGNLQVSAAFVDSLGSPGTSGQVLSSTVTGTDWIDETAGNVDASGTPLDSQIAIWTDASTIEGDSRLTFPGTESEQLVIKSSSGSENAGFALSDNVEGWKIQFRTDPNNGWFEIADSASLVRHRWHANDYLLASTGVLYWSSESNFATSGIGAADVNLFRDSADVLRTNDSLIVDTQVGIGATSLITELTLSSAFAAVAAIPNKISLQDSGYGFGVSAGALNIQTDADVVFYETVVSTPTERMRIATGGSVTIGGTINNATIDDDATLFNLIVGADAGASITDAINTTAIGHQASNANLSADNTTAVGYQALFANITGASNTVVGSRSMQVNTAGFSNTAIGDLTLALNTSGNNNVAIGASSLTLNTTGDKNTAIGHGALSALTIGDGNVAVGDDAGKDCNPAIGAGENTFIGTNTGRGIVTGVQNTILGANVVGLLSTLSNNIILADGVGVIRLQFDSSGDATIGGTINNTTLFSSMANLNLLVGASAGDALTTGSGNTAIGHNVLELATTADGNTAIGSQALAVNVSGDFNTVVGRNALPLNTTGDGNTVLGEAALFSDVLGRRNTVVGQLSGWNIVSATLTGENTLIGYNTGQGITTGVQNSILGANVIGLSATLSNNVILADGAGSIRLQFDSSGDGVIGGGLQVTGPFKDSSGDVGTSGQILSSTVTGTNWISEVGNVSSTGTPVDNQLAIWTDADTIEGVTGLTYDGTDFTIVGNLTVDTNTFFVDATNNKVGIGTTTIPHGSVGSAKLAIEGTNASNSAGPHVQFTISSDDFPLLQVLPFQHDNVSITFDAYHDGSWNSSDVGSNFQISKLSDSLDFNFASGITTGSLVTWTTALALDNSGNVTIPNGTLGLGTISPDTLFHALSSDADTTAVLTLETTGTNLGEYKTFVGSQDPDGNVTGAGGDIYVKDSAALSNMFFNKEATTGTGWETVSLIDPQVHEIFSAAEYEALGTASVITTSSGTNALDFKASVVSSTRHSITSRSAEVMFIDQTESNGVIYTSSTTFITSTVGGDVTFRDVTMVAAVGSTQLLDYAGDGSLNEVDVVGFQGTTALVGWDLGTVSRVSTSEIGPIVTFRDGTILLNSVGSLVLDSVSIFGLNSTYIDQEDETGFDGPIISITDSAYKSGRATLFTLTGTLYTGETLVRVDAGLPDDYRVNVFNTNLNYEGTATVFDTSGSTGAFTAVADNTISATGISSVTDSSGVASFTHAGTSPVLGSLVRVGDFLTNTDYNTTGIVTARTATTFEIDYVPFGTTEAGSFVQFAVTVTATAHGLTLGTGVTLDTTESVSYDGGFLIYNIQTNSFDIPGVFAATEAGTWSTLGLDQTDPRVLAFNNPGIVNSKVLAFGFTNDNTTSTTITDGTYVAIKAATFDENGVTQRFKLTDTEAVIFTLTALEDFEGFLRGGLTAVKSGSTANYRFAMSTNGSVPVFASANFVPMEVKTTAVNVALAFSVNLTTGDTIQIMVAGDGTSDALTITDLVFGIS